MELMAYLNVGAFGTLTEVLFFQTVFYETKEAKF